MKTSRVVGSPQHCGPILGGDFGNKPPNLNGPVTVKTCKWVVEQQDLGATRQNCRQPNEVLLTVTESVRGCLGKVVKIQFLKKHSHPFCHQLFGEQAATSRKHHFIKHCGFKELLSRVLEQDSQPASKMPESGYSSKHFHLSGKRSNETRNCANEGCLPGTVWSTDGYTLSFRYAEFTTRKIKLSMAVSELRPMYPNDGRGLN